MSAIDEPNYNFDETFKKFMRMPRGDLEDVCIALFAACHAAYWADDTSEGINAAMLNLEDAMKLAEYE